MRSVGPWVERLRELRPGGHFLDDDVLAGLAHDDFHGRDDVPRDDGEVARVRADRLVRALDDRQHLDAPWIGALA